MLTNEMHLLRFVIVEGNLLTGTLDEDFLSNHTDLDTLDMSDNMLEGTLPVHFFEMEGLEVLDLHGNMLTGPLPEFPANDVLTFLALHQNEISDTIPDSIINLGALTHLDLSQNLLVGPMSPLFNNITTLTYLFLAENSFALGDIPDYGDLVDLRELSLKSTGRTGMIPDFFAGMGELILLDLDGESKFLAVVGLLRNRITHLAFLATQITS